MFHTINKNVLFTVDAVAVPPIYNQDDKQQVDGVTLGATGQITPQWQVLASFGYLDTESLTQNSVNNGKRLTLSPEFSGSVWTHLRTAERLDGRRWRARHQFGVLQRRQHHQGARLQHRRRAGRSTRVNQHLTLRMNIYNLTDKVYIRNVNNNGARYNPGYSRTAQLTSVIAF